MNSDRRTLIILGVIFAALVAAFIYQSGQLANETATDDPDPVPTVPPLLRVFPDLDRSGETIRAVQLRDPATGSSFTMTRDRFGDWLGAAGEDDLRALDQNAASIIATTMSLISYIRTVDVGDSTDLTQFGFDPEANFYVQFVTDDGEEHVIAVGGPGINTPVQTYYAFIDDRPELYVLDEVAIVYLASQYREPPFP